MVGAQGVDRHQDYRQIRALLALPRTASRMANSAVASRVGATHLLGHHRYMDSVGTTYSSADADERW